MSLILETVMLICFGLSGNGKGTLTIEFLSDDELAEFAKKLSD